MKTRKFELNDEINDGLHLMENTSDNVLLEGKAGTGKSTTINIFTANTHKRVVVLAPTAVAALNIRGQTIHQFCRFPPRMLNEDDIVAQYSPVYRMVDTIIIDEISMVRADLFDNVDRFMRLNGRDQNKPFGGVQMVLVGDLYQLPPVVEKEAGSIIKQRYQSPFFFDAKVAKEMNLKVVSLTKVYRHNNPDFIALLDGIRKGQATEENLRALNARVNRFSATENDSILTLATTNKQSDSINQERLNKLPGDAVTFKAVMTGYFQNMQRDLRNLPVDLELRLKKGARAVFLKNDPAGQWVNGSLGTVVDIARDDVTVRLDETLEEVKTSQVTWEKIRYAYDKINDRIISEVIGVLSQIPLRLAWSVTIHKSQGLTFDKIIVDFTHPVWDSGQAYVALSRCRTLDGISLKKKVYPSDIKVNKSVVEFLKTNAALGAVPTIPFEIFSREAELKEIGDTVIAKGMKE